MALKKQFLKTKPVCKVTFRLPAALAQGATRVHLLGDFNAWDPETLPMKRLKGGDFSLTVDLETGRDYQFRYLLDRGAWENDDAADRYEYNVFAAAENSVVSV